MYVANSSTNTIVEYAHGSRKPTLTITLNGLNGIAVDGKDRLYAVAAFVPAIYRYAPDSTKPRKLPYLFPNGAEPDALALDGSTAIYVSDYLNDLVYAFHIGQSQPFETITKGISGPSHLAFAPNGSLYISDGGNTSVAVYAHGGMNPTAEFNNGFTNITGVALSPPQSL